MKNTVIANRKKGDWEIIKKYFEDRGVKNTMWNGNIVDSEYKDDFYYGVINNCFAPYSLDEAQQAKATILEVSDIEKEFKVGDVVVGWHATLKEYKSKPWEIREILEGVDGIKHARPKGKNDYATYLTSIRHATPEEIKQYKNVSDTVTLPKSFVLEAHKEACSDWKKRIEEVVPELFKKEIPKELESLISKLGKDKILEYLKD